ncbi:MAG: NADH-quinone oxidoreductase subunit NuoN [Gammaproteobacteria bacterium]|nr:NADH-quinone oxidoreductase subunit NuoN [Gammaproteobacteria bacterium]
MAGAAAEGAAALDPSPGDPSHRHQAGGAVNAPALGPLAAATPELALAAGICALLLIDVFAARRGLSATLALLIIAVCAALTIAYGHVSGRTLLFDGLYVADELGFVLKLAGFLVVAVALLYSRDYLDHRDILRGEYYVLALTALLGIFVLISANSLLTVYLGVELLALSVYALVAFDRDSGIAAESAMKYFVLGAIASGALLYGMSLIYGLTGTLDLGEIAVRLNAPSPLGVIVGLVFVVVAVGFKLGAVPFHMWLPDVYEGAPTSVTLFIGTVPKIAYFALALRLLAQGLGGTSLEWSQMLIPLAVLTLVIGNVVALVQTNLKRMLAYSTISNVGFILLGFVAGIPDGYAAALFYTLVYVLVALGSFGVILLASRKGFEADRLDDYRGLQQRDPVLALVMLLMMFSTAGVPPFVGFWAKLRIFQVLWETGHLWLVIIAAAMSVVGAYYYLRVIKLMYFDAPAAGSPAARSVGGARLALGLNALAVLVLGLAPAPLLDLCARVLQ